MAKEPESRKDDFVGRLVPDPKNPPDARLLTGFLGASSEPGHTRLYLDAELAQFVEIPDEAILHTEPLPAEQSSLGGSYVWVRRDASINPGKGVEARMRARFFEGPILEEFGGGVEGPAMAEAGVAAQIVPTVLVVCRSFVDACPTRFTICSRIVICRSLTVICNQVSLLVRCLSVQIRCPTEACPVLDPGPVFSPGQMAPQAAEAAGAAAAPQISVQIACLPQSFTIPCTSQTVACQSRFCPSSPVLCASSLCPTTTIRCQSRIICPSRLCPSQTIPCQSQICPSQTIPCQTQVCPSQTIPCQTQACPSQACPSVACPSQFVCPSQVCPSQLSCPSQLCGGGGFGGFDPGGGGF